MNPDTIRAWIADPMVYPIFLGLILAVGLVVVTALQAALARPSAFSWALLGQWADDLVGPIVLLAVLGLVLFLAGLGAPEGGPARLILTGLDVVYVGATITYDTSLGARLGAKFTNPPPTAR